MQKPWSLYNKEDKLRIDDLTPEQVRIVLLATATARMSHWYACQEGDLHWQPISAIPEFYEDVRQIKGRIEDEEPAAPASPATSAVQAPVPEEPAIKDLPRRPLFEEGPSDATAPTLQMENINTKERRTARRYPRRLDFYIDQDGKTFNSSTVDISMSGLSLATPLPAWVPKTFRAVLSMNGNQVHLLCGRVSDQQLRIKEASSWHVIRAWIVNW